MKFSTVVGIIFLFLLTPALWAEGNGVPCGTERVKVEASLVAKATSEGRQESPQVDATHKVLKRIFSADRIPKGKVVVISVLFFSKDGDNKCACEHRDAAMVFAGIGGRPLRDYRFERNKKGQWVYKPR